ncbi:MAG TPA: CoB--CoM heterodisulfide reductase iron-sulfur subunit B family protein [Anaerolineaceae bacterium]|nr:CoB--CoM heterodisulfide reductase iron-sulfur subunit B family protein [Anaerolineaceae bacterium]
MAINVSESEIQLSKLMEYSYYPGCSLHSTAREFDDSIQSIFKTLDIKLYELDDWNCCSAASATTLNHALSLALPGRNLAIAQKSGRDMLIPCTGCYNRHKSTEFELKRNSLNSTMIEAAVGFKYQGNFEVRSLLDVVGNEIGMDRIHQHVQKPLTGLKVVGYYGCLLLRPTKITQFENPEKPILLMELLQTLGAEVMPWSYAMECCGGDQTLVRPEIAVRLVNRLVEHAREAGAQAMVTVCPLCQMSLEMRQTAPGTKMPLFYFTELIGLAFGLKEAPAWWKKHLISPENLMNSLGL